MAANTQRAVVEVRGTSGDQHRFRLGTGAICRLEETLDLDVMQLFEKLQQGKVRLSLVREFVKAASVDEPEMNNEQANDVIDDVGVMPLLDAMTDSILLTFNIKKTAKPNGAEEAPPTPEKKRRRGGTATLNAPPPSAH